MNDQTAVVMQKLADKLGTTSEYLWSVLIRQAPLSGITDILQYAIIAICVFVYWRWVSSDKRDFSGCGDSWPGALIVGIPLLFLVVVVFFWFPTTIYAFANPEYWALDRVLHAIKSK
jgi:amino acid transporter